MVIILRRLVERTVCVVRNPQNFLIWQKTMAWRSSGTDNADLINQLEGKFVREMKKNKNFFDLVKISV